MKLRPTIRPGDAEWRELCEGAREARSDLFLLNEMPFGSWLAAAPEPDRQSLLESHALHDEGIELLGELGTKIVLGSRPTFEAERSVNQAFAWDASRGLTPVHTKQFFPNEEGFWEARWFERGETHFRTIEAGGARAGFLICSEAMFNEWARHYGRQGAHLIVVPRATSASLLPRWRTALSMAAIVSGCYVVSSNRAGVDRNGRQFGGHGWVFDPTGELIAETTPERPVASVEVDLAFADRAKEGYPCNVEELPQPAIAGALYV